MDRKNHFRRGKTQSFSSSPWAAPLTEPPPANSEPATTFSPLTSFSKVVTLSDWWLIKSDSDAGGKRLAVEGFNAKGMFTSAPIVERYNAYTVKTADGIIVMFQGRINEARNHQNGFPTEVSRCFVVGFPSNWADYAVDDFWNKPTCRNKHPGPSWSDEQLEHLSHATGGTFLTCLGSLLDIFNSSNYTTGDGNLSRVFNISPPKHNCISSASTALGDPVDIPSAAANARLPVEPLRRYVEDKPNQNWGTSMECADRITHVAKENEIGHAMKASCSEKRLHYAVLGTRSDGDDRVIMSHTNPSTVKQNCMGQHEMDQDMQIENGTEFEKDNNLARPPTGKLDPVAQLPNDKVERSKDESIATTINSVVEGVLNDSSLKEHFQQCNQSGSYAGKFQNDSKKSRDHGVVIFEDLPPRKSSAGMHCNSLAATMNLPMEASFVSPPSGARRNVDNTPTSAGSVEKLSSSLRRILYSDHGKRFSDYVLKTGNHAQRIRLDHTSDSEVRRDSNINEVGSLTVDPRTVLENVIKAAKIDKYGKLNNKHTVSSTDSPVKKVLNNWLPTEGTDTHAELESRQCPYPLRSRNRVGKTVNDMCVLGDSLGRTNSKEADAYSSEVEMNVPSEPFLDLDARRSRKTPKKKMKGKGIHVSLLEESSSTFQHNLQFFSTASTSPDGISKKGVDHSEHNNSVGTHSGKAGDITRKRVLELPNNQDSEALTETHHRKKKTLSRYKRKTIWRPSYSQEFRLTRGKANKLSVTFPELLDLKRSRSGRFIVPPIESWRLATTRHDMDGIITGITHVNDLDASHTGMKSQHPKKRKRRH